MRFIETWPFWLFIALWFGAYVSIEIWMDECRRRRKTETVT